MVLKRFALLALLTAYPAAATTMVVTGVDSATGWTNSLWIDENGTNAQLYFAGGIDITVAGYTRLVYCVDMLTNIGVPGTYNTIMDFSDSANLKRVGWLMQNEFPTSALYTGAALQLHGAAFQLAIWDIMSDSGNGFGTATTPAGIVSQSTDAAHPTDAGVLSAAQQYLADSLNKTSTYGIVYHNKDSNGIAVQTLMGRNATDGGPSATPEPAALIMIFSGLALIAMGRLRRSNPR